MAVLRHKSAVSVPLDPVSYTHLDVYKRQASTSAPTESSGSAGSTQPDQEGFLTNQNEPLTHASALGLYESLDVSEDQRVEILDMNEDYIFLSVNYDAFEIELTREVGFTDVYKRQIMDYFGLKDGASNSYIRAILLDGGASTELYGNDFYAHTTIQHKIPQMISVGQA